MLLYFKHSQEPSPIKLTPWVLIKFHLICGELALALILWLEIASFHTLWGCIN